METRESINLKARLGELPKAAYDRLTPERVGISKSAFYGMLRGDYPLSETIIRKFSKALRCQPHEFMDPDFRFRDFRTAREIREDQDK